MYELYPNPALVPSLKGFPTGMIASPSGVRIQNSIEGPTIVWDKPTAIEDDVHATKYHVVYRFSKNTKPNFDKGHAIIALTGKDSYLLETETNDSFDYYVSALDRLYNESIPTKVNQ